MLRERQSCILLSIGRLITGLLPWMGLLGGSACSVELGAQFVAWPEVPPDTLSFLLHLHEGQRIYGPFGPAGPDAPLPLTDGASTIYAISRASIESIHPFVVGSRLEETELVAAQAECAGCSACAVRPGDRVLAPLPPFPATQSWKRGVGGQFLAVDGAVSSESLVLSLPAPRACAGSMEVEVEVVHELLAGSWTGTLPAGSGAIWVHGPDLLLVPSEGTPDGLSRQLELTSVTDIKATGDGAFLATLNEPPRVVRVSTSTGGIVVEQTWALGLEMAQSVASADGGGFVATTSGLGELWFSERGDPPIRAVLPISRTLVDVLRSPFRPHEFFLGAGFGSVFIVDPFTGPPTFREAKIPTADKGVRRFALRSGSRGPELWAATNGAGLYVQTRELHERNEWRIEDALVEAGRDNCAGFPECGFAALNRDAVDVDVNETSVVVRVAGCEAILLISPDKGCATRLEMPAGVPGGLSLDAGHLWGIRPRQLVRVVLPGP